MENNKKNNKGLIVLVIFLIVIIIGLSGFIVYDKTNNKTDKKESTTKINVEKDNKATTENTKYDISNVKGNYVYNNGKDTSDANYEKYELILLDNGLFVYTLSNVSNNTFIGNYYIDNMGSVMPLSRHYVAHVLVASGYINKEFAMNELYHFVQFLQDNEFWNNQIDQIYVDADQEVELIPLVGNHKILLGSFDDYQKKLDNLKLFYEQAIPKVGWEKYSLINLKYRNQIVCTKR